MPIVSDSAPDEWRGELGLIDEVVVRKYVSDLNQPIYYLSGPEGMVKAMRQLLVGLNVNEDKIRRRPVVCGLSIREAHPCSATRW